MLSLFSLTLRFGLLFLTIHSHVLFYSSSLAALPRCHPDESSALLQLNATNVFNKSTDCCTWDEVVCDEATSHVVGLYVKLEGSDTITSNSSLFLLRHLQSLTIIDQTRISESAFKALARNLTRLEELNLIGIDMSSVPLASLTNLSSSLTYLRIQSCQLLGELPYNFFHSFPKLETLSLRDNNLSGQLPEFGNNSTPQNFSLSLTELWLSDNLFTGPIPSWMYGLRYLMLLILSNNRFTGVIGNFQTPMLTNLRLDRNKLQGAIPRSLFQNVELMLLDLSLNDLSGNVEFEDISKLQELSDLNLSFNNLSISSYSTNNTLEKGIAMRLSSCNFVEFPTFLKSCKSLQMLDLSNNQIKGSVPKWLWELNKDSLLYLNLSNNSLTCIHRLPWFLLRILDLRSNLFSGPLPILSPSLYLFLVSKNNFLGEIPDSICNMTSLRVLDLSSNNLTGNIPQCIGNLTESLSVLDLRRNKLNGTIPTIFPTGNRLRSLDLNGNQLEGKLPRALVNCSDLEVLDLGNNVLDDVFPHWLESLPKLQVLVLRANRFHGSIGNPRPGFPFLKLRIMDLSCNKFTGALPTKYFNNFKAMTGTENSKMGYMGENFYQDSVIVTMKGRDLELVKVLTIFTTIDFSMNNFAGQIPESLGKLKSLKGLNFSNNMLTGILPSSLGNLSNLEWLDLSSNELVGKIPLELADITALEFFNVSHNHLEGPIPQGRQFNTFGNESFMGNSDLCGFPMSKKCGQLTEPSPPPPTDLGQDDERDSSVTNGFNWKIVMMGYASGFVIGISVGYMLLYSNGTLGWLSDTILKELHYTKRPTRPKRLGNARRL